jgi:hypothetical protein
MLVPALTRAQRKKLEIIAAGGEDNSVSGAEVILAQVLLQVIAALDDEESPELEAGD